MSSIRGRLPGASANSSRSAPKARARPTAPPAIARTTLSSSSSRAMPFVPAPRAARTASSCCRDSARTSSRFATFAQATSSTRPIVPISTQMHPLDVADEVVFQREHPRREPRFLEHLHVHPRKRRKQGERDRNQPGDVRLGLLVGRARFQPRDGVEAELSEKRLAAIELVGDDERHAAIEESKASPGARRSLRAVCCRASASGR